MNLIGVNSPVRLLREKWSNPVDLAQELYAMFTAKGPAELHDTLTIKVPAGKTALRIEQVDNSTSETHISHGGIAKNSISTAPSVPGRRSPPPTPQSTRIRNGPETSSTSCSPTQNSSSPPAIQGPFRREVPLVEIAGSVAFTGKAPIQFSQPPIVVNPRTGREERLATTDQISQPTTASSVPYFGIVTEGTGDTYRVQFYSAGFVGSGTGIYTVKIPNIDPNETIPAGTKLFPIWLVSGVYYHQPPVWME